MVTSPFLVSIEWRIVARLVARIRTLNPDVQPLPKILQGQIIQKQQDHLHLQKVKVPLAQIYVGGLLHNACILGLPDVVCSREEANALSGLGMHRLHN